MTIGKGDVGTVKRDKDDGVTGRDAAIPGAMLADEGAVAVLLWEGRARVEGEAQL